MPPRSPNPRQILAQARSEDSVDLLKSAIDLSRTQAAGDWSYEKFVPSALASCVSDNKIDLARHILENEPGPLKNKGKDNGDGGDGDEGGASLPFLPVGTDHPLEMLELLVAHGWDVNQKTRGDWRLIDAVFADDQKVRFLLDHGATVDHGAEELYFPELQSKQPPALLEKCAAAASFETFRLVRERGAKLGRRTLHRTAASAAAIGADPTADYGDEAAGEEESDEHRRLRQRRWNRVAVLRVLVDEMRLDVNALDTDEKGHAYWDQYHGTPLCYVARAKDGLAVARWLLDKGADPRVKNTRDVDAVEEAREKGNEDVAKLFEEWIAARGAAGYS